MMGGVTFHASEFNIFKTEEEKMKNIWHLHVYNLEYVTTFAEIPSNST